MKWMKFEFDGQPMMSSQIETAIESESKPMPHWKKTTMAVRSKPTTEGRTTLLETLITPVQYSELVEDNDVGNHKR